MLFEQVIDDQRNTWHAKIIKKKKRKKKFKRPRGLYREEICKRDTIEYTYSTLDL